LIKKEKFAKARMSAVVETVGESRLDTATEAALIVTTRLHFNLTILWKSLNLCDFIYTIFVNFSFVCLKLIMK
jgi:hypothetical protein